jgi:hypothetical protein
MVRKKKKEWQKKGWSKPGHKLGQLSGNKSQLKPSEQSARERVARLAEGSPEWNLLRLVKLIEAEKKNLLADKEVMLHPAFPLSKEENNRQLQYGQRSQIFALLRSLFSEVSPE